MQRVHNMEYSSAVPPGSNMQVCVLRELFNIGKTFIAHREKKGEVIEKGDGHHRCIKSVFRTKRGGSGAGSRSVSQRYGSANMDPDQNVTNPEHWQECLVFFTFLLSWFLVSVLWNRNDLLRLQFWFWKSFHSDSGSSSDTGPDNIWHSFPTTKNLYKILSFQSQKSIISMKVEQIFNFLTFFITFMLDPDPSVNSLFGDVTVYMNKSGLEFYTFKEPKNRFQGIYSASLCSLSPYL